MSDSDLVDAITDSVLRSIQARPASNMVYATWLSVDPLDSALSVIAFPDGSTVYGVQKLGSTSALVADDVVLVLNDKTKPLIILDKILGDISVYGA